MNNTAAQAFIKETNVTVKQEKMGQPIDGFGVNINSKHFSSGKLMPIMELLTEDLRAALYRVDIYGKSDWIDPNSTLGRKAALSEAHMKEVFQQQIFKDGFAMLRYLNENGIQPYLTCSGDVPTWMLGEDGRTLSDYEAFCDMLVAYIDYVKNIEKIDFTLFGPLNETDLGSPEGPTVPPEAYAAVCCLLDQKLTEKGLDDIRLVVPEQAMFDPTYIEAFQAFPQLSDRIGSFALHCYGDLTDVRYQGVYRSVDGTAYAGKHFWLSEYGDLDQTGEKEWYIAQKSTERVFHAIENGFSGAMQWDAYDNYHDHDQAFTIYGLIRFARNIATPKKRFYAAKQLYRFVRPGDTRRYVENSETNMRLLAFTGAKAGALSVVGMNRSDLPHLLNIKIDSSLFSGKRLHHFRTSATENCVRLPDLDLYSKIDGKLGDTCEVLVPPHCIFTVTTLD